MHNLDKKQKIILSILASIIIISIGYYVYSKDESYQELEINETREEAERNTSTNNINEQPENQEPNKETIVVHVSGAVNKEGIVKLEANSRVADAIENAGGLKPDANMKEVNLASKLEDGMKIYIPSNTEQEVQENNNNTSSIMQNSMTNKKQTSKININTASQEELDSLPGIGESTALKIIKYRKENGKFSKIEDLKNVSGIGEAKFNQLKDLITV